MSVQNIALKTSWEQWTIETGKVTEIRAGNAPWWRWLIRLLRVSLTHFSMPNSILISWLHYFYCVYQNPPVFFFFFFGKYLYIIYVHLVVGPREFVIWLPYVYFFSTWLCEIISITFNSDESESPRNLPLWIFTSVGFVLLLSIPQSSFSRHFVMKLMICLIFYTFADILLSK